MRWPTVLLAALLCAGCTTPPSPQSAADADIHKITPIPDPNAPSGVYVPADIEDCFRELDKMLSPRLKAQMKNNPKGDMIQYHLGLGMWMRNNWGLWGDSRLRAYFTRRFVFEPDNMSGLILDNYWNHLNGKPAEMPPPLSEGEYQRYKSLGLRF